MSIKRSSSSAGIKTFLNPNAKQMRMTTIGSSGQSIRTIHQKGSRTPLLDLTPTTPVLADIAQPQQENNKDDGIKLTQVISTWFPTLPSISFIYQTGKVIDEFEKEFDHIVQLLLRHHAHPLVGDPCDCEPKDGTKNKRNTMCRDCFQYTPSCEACFIRQHHHLPFHWAHVWDFELGFFLKKDISTLSIPFALHLNHGGATCPRPLGSIDNKFIVMSSNGVHATLIRFCDCVGSPSKVEQLCGARLFPATTQSPTTAFTFEVLKSFHIHSLQSKSSAYDFVGAIQRLAENVFTHDIPVSISQWSHPTSNCTYRIFINNLIVLRECGDILPPSKGPDKRTASTKSWSGVLQAAQRCSALLVP